jgi:hypothetical protein
VTNYGFVVFPGAAGAVVDPEPVVRVVAIVAGAAPVVAAPVVVVPDVVEVAVGAVGLFALQTANAIARATTTVTAYQISLDMTSSRFTVE